MEERLRGEYVGCDLCRVRRLLGDYGRGISVPVSYCVEWELLMPWRRKVVRAPDSDVRL